MKPRCQEFDENTDLCEGRTISEYLNTIRELSNITQNQLGNKFHSDKVKFLINLLHRLEKDITTFEGKPK